MNEPIVEPGHNEYGIERAFTPLCFCDTCRRGRTPVEVDIDLLQAIADEYTACVRAGSHPEWTIGGMGR